MTFGSTSAVAYDEKLVDGMCKAGQENVRFILAKLLVKYNFGPSDKNLETYRGVYAEAMSDDLTRAQQVFSKEKDASKKVGAYLSLNEIHYKFGLCEKYKRNNAQVGVIASEYYMLCRKEFLENRDVYPPPCF